MPNDSITLIPAATDGGGDAAGKDAERHQQRGFDDSGDDRENDAEARMEPCIPDAPLERPPVPQPEERRRERGADVHGRHPADEHVLPGHGLAPIEARHRVLGDVEQPGRPSRRATVPQSSGSARARGATSPAHSAVGCPEHAPAFDEAALREDERSEPFDAAPLGWSRATCEPPPTDRAVCGVRRAPRSGSTCRRDGPSKSPVRPLAAVPGFTHAANGTPFGRFDKLRVVPGSVGGTSSVEKRKDDNHD